MLDWVRKRAESLVGLGFAVAGKTVAQVLDAVFDAARLVHRATGLGDSIFGPMEQAVEEATPSGGTSSQGVPYPDFASEVRSEPEPNQEPAPEESEKVRAKEPEPQRASAKPAPSRGKQKSRGPKKTKGTKSARAKRSPVRAKNSQILRLLEILAENPKQWMTAVELSKATADRGKKILPGNIRKAIRLRGEGLIEARVRPGSTRGATEYRITRKGLALLEESK